MDFKQAWLMLAEGFSLHSEGCPDHSRGSWLGIDQIRPAADANVLNLQRPVLPLVAPFGRPEHGVALNCY